VLCANTRLTPPDGVTFLKTARNPEKYLPALHYALLYTFLVDVHPNNTGCYVDRRSRNEPLIV